MIETLRKETIAKFTLGLFVALTTWWIVLQFMNLPNDSVYNQLWAASYGVVAFWGGLVGVRIARRWGGLRSLMGKSIFFFSIGLFSQEVGQLLYSYYIYYLDQPLPYPSIGDYFFWATIPLYIVAVLYLARASGVRISLRSVKGKMQALLIPAIVLILCYIIFLKGHEFDWFQPVKILIDLGVPVGEAIYVSLAFLTYVLTRGVLGGIMKSKVLFILIALLAEYVSDWTFLYQASRQTWYAGGINDYMYLCAFFLMAFGLIQFNGVFNKLKGK